MSLNTRKAQPQDKARPAVDSGPAHFKNLPTHRHCLSELQSRPRLTAKTETSLC
jgi:hypothetical protein